MKLTKQRLKEIIKEEIRNFLKKRNLNERLSGKTVTWQIRTQERRTAKKVLDKLKLKVGKDYDFKFISNTFALELLKKHENKVLELFIKNRINVN